MISFSLGALIQCFDWERVGKKMLDLTVGSGLFAMSKTRPFEAVCTPCPSMANILSQL